METLNKTMEDKLNEGRSYRNMVNFEVRESDDDEMIAEGYATTFNESYELFSYDNWEGYRVHFMEQVDPDAFRETEMDDTIMQYNHEGRVFARNRNKTLELESDEHGLRIRAKLGGTEIGRQLYEEIKGGYTDRMSFAFVVSDQHRVIETVDSRTIVTRHITGIRKLYDVSAVSMPANDSTTISARSWCDGVIAELEAERLSALEASRRKLALKIKLTGG